MKVTFLKYHLGFKQGDSIETSTDQANYWIRTGVAEAAKSSEAKAPVKPAPKAPAKPAAKVPVKNNDDDFEL